MKFLKIERTGFNKYECGKAEPEKIPFVGVGRNAEEAVRAYFEGGVAVIIKFYNTSKSDIDNLQNKLSLSYKYEEGKHYISKDLCTRYEIKTSNYLVKDTNDNIYIAKIIFPYMEAKIAH